MISPYKLTLATIILCLFSLDSFAQKNRGSLQTTKIGIVQQTYSGSVNKSFAEGSPAYGVELSTDRGNTVFRYFLKARINYSEGRQNFLNSTAVFASNYKFTAFAPELGFNLYPVSRRERGVNMYLWAIGIISYNLLELTTTPASSNIPAKEQVYGYGYGGGIGIEFMLGTGRARSRNLLYGEIGFRDERSQLVKENAFEVSGMTTSVGIGF